jgi:hypothetical protein
MRILLAHIEGRPGAASWYREIAASAGPGLEVRPFALSLESERARLAWPELDRRWRRRDRRLLALYEKLLRAAENSDVLLLYNGANLHPELLPALPTFNVYCCFDDPESSAALSQPVAVCFDAVFHGNIASRFQYEHWGCRKLAWLPVFSSPTDLPDPTEVDSLLRAERDLEIVFCGDRSNPWRSARLDALAAAFPQAQCRGQGWNAAPLDDAGLRMLYRRARIGWNVHNSTGPINRRLFALAAFGVLQICDNKTGLAPIFELGREVIGFDTIPEAIELTRHYLAHPDEARAIAQRGCARFWRDYHPQAIWSRIHAQLLEWGAAERRDAVPARRLPRVSLASAAASAFAPARSWLHASRRALRVFRDERRASTRPATAPDDRFYRGEDCDSYLENPGMPKTNLASERLEQRGFLDWPDILALNWAVSALIGDAKRIAEIGSGTGPFAEYAARDRSRELHCFEPDDFARAKAIELRSFPNVHYHASWESDTSARYDLLVSIEVIEHVPELEAFLSSCARLAPRAIYTTPNRVSRYPAGHFGPPSYPAHVREFSAGEIFWMLRLYYRQVRLFHLPDPFVPWLAPLDIATPGSPVIADCRDPIAARPPVAAMLARGGPLGVR